jgi:SAM-dependent methyltransferase
MFGDHTYLSGVTKSLSSHFRNIADQAVTRFFSDVPRQQVSVLDIGSNDGTQLRHFMDIGCDVLGVESSKTTAAIAISNGVPTVNRFFNNKLALEMGRKFKIINAAGVFFHLEELHSATEGIREALDKDGVFVVQFLYMNRILENLAFDQIYHEHLLYYNLQTIEVLLNRHGLETFDAWLAPIHGGSMIAFVTHKGARMPSDRLQAMRRAEKETRANEFQTYRQFATDIDEMRDRNLNYLEEKRSEGKVVFGMGAPVKGNTLLNYFGIGTQYLKVLAEKNSLRKGLVSPGMHIPVVMEDDSLPAPDIWYVLAWNFKDEILANNRNLIEQGVEFYFPIDPRKIV